MDRQLEERGYAIVPGLLNRREISELREELASISSDKEKNCIRDICSVSPLSLAVSEKARARFAKELLCVRSILFDKTPDRNWPVAWHQDLTILVSEKVEVPGYGPWSVKDGIDAVQPPVETLQSMVTVRVHLDDTSEANGALRVVPGSHRFGKIPSESVADYTDKSVVCSCSAGDVLIMSPLLLHSSGRSTVDGHRRVLHFEYAREESLAPELQWAVNRL